MRETASLCAYISKPDTEESVVSAERRAQVQAASQRRAQARLVLRFKETNVMTSLNIARDSCSS